MNLDDHASSWKMGHGGVNQRLADTNARLRPGLLKFTPLCLPVYLFARISANAGVASQQNAIAASYCLGCKWLGLVIQMAAQ